MNYLSSDLRQLLLHNYTAPNLEGALKFFSHWEDNLLDREGDLATQLKNKRETKQPIYNIPSINIDEILKNELVKREANLRRRELELIRREA